MIGHDLAAAGGEQLSGAPEVRTSPRAPLVPARPARAPRVHGAQNVHALRRDGCSRMIGYVLAAAGGKQLSGAPEV